MARVSDYAIRRPVENTYLVRQRDRRRTRELVRVLLTILPLGAVLWTYTWIHVEVIDTCYRIDSLERELHDNERRERQLLVEAAYLANPKRVKARAMAELGMTPLGVDQVIAWRGGPAR